MGVRDSFMFLWIVVDRCGLAVAGCGWLWVVVGRCGWLWVVVDGCGSLWMVVDHSSL